MAPLPHRPIDSHPVRTQERLTRSQHRIAQARRTLARVLHWLEATQQLLDRQTQTTPPSQG